jgi:hypothetical protein
MDIARNMTKIEITLSVSSVRENMVGVCLGYGDGEREREVRRLLKWKLDEDELQFFKGARCLGASVRSKAPGV